MVALEQGDEASARRHPDEATRSTGALQDPLVAALAPMLRALRHMDGSASGRALTSLAAVPSALDEVVAPSAEAAARRANLALVADGRGRAAELLRPVLSGDPADSVGGRIEAWLSAARSHLLAGARPLAREALSRALALAEPERRRRLLLRPGPYGRGLVVVLPDLVAARAWLGMAPAGRPGGTSRDREPHVTTGAAPVEHLTGRERTVIVRMAQAMSAEDIAEDLFLSVNTVKTHQRNIYRKLAVSRRYDAVRKARGLGLV